MVYGFYDRYLNGHFIEDEAAQREIFTYAASIYGHNNKMTIRNYSQFDEVLKT
jgi:hypothetical protein